MKKRNDLQSAEQIPKLLKLLIHTISFFSSKTTTALLGYIFSRPLRHKPHAREKEFIISSKKETHFIPSINKRIKTYEMEGSSKKVLLVHGWSGRGSQLSSIATECNKKGFFVVSFDAPAHGGSSSNTTNVPEFVEAINFLNTTKGPFDYAIGHSIGGICIMNSLRFGDMYKKMVTISSPHVNVDMFKDFIFKIGLKEKSLNKLLEVFKSKVGSDVESYDLIKCAKISNTPTLILHCDDDRDIPVECSKESIKHFKKGKIIITKGLGHRRILRNKSIVKSVVNFLKN